MYTIQPVPGQGVGVFATADIPKGTRIVSEPPLLRVRTTHHAYKQDVIAAANELTEEQMQTLMSLRNNHPGRDSNPVQGIVDTNAFDLANDHGLCEIGVFSQSSLFNHACNPNAIWSFNPQTNLMTIHALKDIQGGQQITVSYISTYEPYADRQKSLTENQGFTCRCDLCSLPLDEREKSDGRRKQIALLDQQTGSAVAREAFPFHFLWSLRAMKKLYEQEGVGDGFDMPVVYARAMYVAAMHGDQARASVFADKLYDANLTMFGEDDSRTIAAMDKAMAPAEIRQYGQLSMVWATELGDVPLLGGEEFEKWLWRL